MRNGCKSKIFLLLTSFCWIFVIYVVYWMYHHTEPQNSFGVSHPEVHTGGPGVRVGPGKRNKVRKLPGCLLIGVRKGGTRALIDMMSLHTRIKSASNEVHFFDNDINFSKGYDWYKEQMPSGRPHDIAIEKSPSYFVTEIAPERVHAMNKSILLLLIVRDPVTRLISDYTQILHNHLEKGMHLKPLENLALDNFGNINTGYDALNRSLYYHHMKMWLKYFPLSQFHIVNGDRLIQKPWQEIIRVEKFLGVDHQITREHFYYNATKGFHCIRQADEERCLAKSKGRPHPNISVALVHKLRKFFRPHNYKFYNLVGEDFGWADD